VAARSLILAAPPREAAVLLEPLAPVTAEWERAAVPVRAACLDLALRRPPRPAAAFALGIDEPLYASVHTRAARLAPGGGSVLQLARYLGASAPTDPTAVEGQLEDLAERLQPGWRNELVARRFLPDLVVANALPRADQGGLSGRPGPEVPGLPGAFVAGDWVGGRGLLADAALASAEEAARLAIAHASRSRPAA
jgi:phytoene dehydrogenase-like protein